MQPQWDVTSHTGERTQNSQVVIFSYIAVLVFQVLEMLQGTKKKSENEWRLSMNISENVYKISLIIPK